MQKGKTIFNPAAFDPASQGGNQKADKETKEEKEYPTTGNASRDTVRKVLFETLVQDLGSSAKLSARGVVDQLESEILKQCKDPKSRQYRDMARVIQNKLKGPRFVETRQQLLDGTLSTETVCSDEFLQGKTSAAPKQGPPQANAPRPGRPIYQGKIGITRAPPGQPVRPRMGVPNLGRPGFRPVAPRAPGPFTRPAPVQNEQAQELVDPQTEQTTTTNDEIDQVSQPGQQVEIAPALDSRSSHSQNLIAPVESDPTKVQRGDDQKPMADYFGHQPEQTHQEEINFGAPNMQQTMPDQGVSTQLEDSTNMGIGPQVQATLELEPVHSPAQEPNLSQHTDNSQLDVSTNSASAKPGIPKGKKKKKKKGSAMPKSKEGKEEERLLEQQQNLTRNEPPKVTEKPETPIQNESVALTEPERFPVGAFDAPPQQQNQLQAPDGLDQVDEVSLAREHSPTNRNSLNAPPPAEIEQEQPEPVVQVRSQEQAPSNEPDPFVLEQNQTITHQNDLPQNDQQPVALTEVQSVVPVTSSVQAIRPLQLDHQVQESQDGTEPPLTTRYPLTSRSALMRGKASSAGGQAELIRLQNELQSAKKEAELAMEHNKQVKEDARRARYEKKQSEQALEAYKLQSDQQVQLLKAQLNLKEQAVEKLKREFTELAEEKEGYKARVMKLTKESQQARENMEEQMRSALQRMASQGGSTPVNLLGAGQQPASGVVMTSTQSQGQNSGSISGASNQQELQKEMQVMRQHYESQLQEHKHQLQMRIKDLQRVERQNISLSEQNKNLSDLNEQLQVQNLSTVAGSGSFQTTQPPGAHHSNSAQMMQSQHLSQGVQQQQTSGYAGTAGNTLSSGGQGTVQILESGDADDGGRDGENRYFTDVTQDEGTGGVRYNQQNPMEAIPQSSSGISGHQYNNHSGAGGGSSFGAVGHNQSRFAAGGGIDGGYGQLPENGDENSDEENSEPEREHQHEEDDDQEVDDDGYYQNYETVGDWYGQSNLEDQRRRPRDQAPGNQTEMDVGGVHNETGDENEESNEDDEDGVGESVALGNGKGQNRQGDTHSSNPPGFSDGQPKQRVNNHQSQQLQNMIEDDQEGEVEDGSRGEEGGCRESNYAEEEIEQSLSITGGIGSGLAQDPETEVLPSKGNAQQPSSMLLAQQFSDNNTYPPASAGGVVETGRKMQVQHPYEEEEGGEDIFVHHHHGGNENEDNEYMVEEEEKGDGASKAFKGDVQSSSQVSLQGQSQSAGAGFGIGINAQRLQQPQSSISLGAGAAQSNLQNYRNQSATSNQIALSQQVANQSLTQEQQQQMMGIYQEESSNGGASVTCQHQTNAVVAAGSARVVPTAPSLMQSTQGTGNGGQQRVGPSPLSTSQGRNPRRGHKQQFQQQSTHKSRQGGGAGGNMQTRNQMQSSQQSRSSGRNTRQGPQRTNQQQFLIQAAPSGEQSQSASQMQLFSNAQSQQMIDAPSSQASATGSLAFNQNQKRTGFGVGNQQPLGGSQSQQILQSNLNEESKVELGQSNLNGIANNQNLFISNTQSSSMASGGSSSTATMMQQMPASHASASASATNHGNQTANQQYQSSASQQLTSQAALGAVNQQKGVVHTAGQSSQLQPQSSGTGVPAPRQPVNNGLRANNGQQQPQQQQEMMNAESGSTAFTSQSMQRSYNNQLSQQTPHVSVSSPPSTSQTGGGGSISSIGPHQNSAALGQLDNQEAASAGGICAGDTDFYVAAVGAPPSRSGAAGITQSNSSGQNAMRQPQTQITESSQNQAGANNAQSQMSSNRQYPGQIHQHQRFGSRGNMPGGYHGSRPHGVQDQQSLHSQSVTFLSGSGEQEEQPPSMQSQFGAGSAASAAGGGSAANENAMYQSASNPYQQMHHIQQMQQQDTGNSQNHQSQMQLNNSMQLQQMQNQGSESRKTSGANTPSKDGAETPPYRDTKPQNSNYIHNLTTKLLVLQNQDGENSRGRASSANREQNANQSAAEEQKVGSMPPGMFE